MDMLKSLVGLAIACAAIQVHAQEFMFNNNPYPHPSATKNDTGNPYLANDSDLIVENGLTVFDLQRLSPAELDTLFSKYSVAMKCLPIGPSAGRPGYIGEEYLKSLGPAGEQFSKLLNRPTQLSWYGKVFNPGDCLESSGENRIFGDKFVIFKSRVIELNQTRVSGLHVPPQANMVELNYSHPFPDHYFKDVVNPVDLAILLLVKKLGIYDLMVAIPGKYGPIYVGRTWFGNYDHGLDLGSFINTSKQTNWYFLDFNQRALDEQQARLGYVPKVPEVLPSMQ